MVNESHIETRRTYPQDVKEEVHEGVTVRLNLLVQSASNVADQPNGHGAKTSFLLVLKSIVEEGAERLHVLGKVFLQSAGDGADGGKDHIRNAGLATDSGQDAEQDLHDAISLRLNLDLESLNNSLVA